MNPEDVVPKVVGIYVRVSTGNQDAENQLIQIRNYCQKMHFSIYCEYVDVISGKEESRPGWNRMFQDAHQRNFDMIIFWALDRFSRSGTLDTLTKLRELENLGVKWASFTEPYFDSAGQFKDVVLSIMATLASIEREKISERTKAVLARARANGFVPGRKKGERDKKPRKRKGYYGNTNRRGNKLRGVELVNGKPKNFTRYTVNFDELAEQKQQERRDDGL